MDPGASGAPAAAATVHHTPYDLELKTHFIVLWVRNSVRAHTVGTIFSSPITEVSAGKTHRLEYMMAGSWSHPEYRGVFTHMWSGGSRLSARLC